MNHLPQVVLAFTGFDISLIASVAVLAQLTVVALVVGAVVWVVRPSARAALAGPASFLARRGVWFAWLVAVVAMASSLWLSEHNGFDPCHLCDLQRFFMYPLVIMLAGVALVGRRWLTWAAITYPLIGLCVSIRHVYVEVNPSSEDQACKIGVPCSFRWVDEFGYVTIPVMAGTAFLLIIVLLAITGASQRNADA